MGVIRFAVLGPLAATRDGVPLPLGGPKPRALLAYLLLNGGRQVSMDALVEVLWGAAPPVTAVKTVQKYVSVLRQQLGDPAVIRSWGDGYGVTAGSDANDFERLADDGDAAVAAEPERGAALLTEALALWHGQPYADLGDVPAADAERRRLDERRLAAVESLADARLALGHHRALTGWLEEQVASHPLRERLWAQLMTALYGAGRQADALAAYRRLRTTLVEELGVEPAPDVQRLHERILAHRLDNRPAAGYLPQALTSFVGRDRELAELPDLVREHRMVTLTGAAGSGKTRLAVEVAGRLASRYPAGVWFVELAPLVAGTRVAPIVATALRLAEQPDRDVAEVLLDHLADRRLLLVLDNAEHVADSVASFADEALRRVPGLRMLCTSRQPIGVAGEVTYEVPPLPAADATRLLVARARTADPHFAPTADNAPGLERICRRLDGMPLALELAAARLRAFDPVRLADLLDDRFRLLVSTVRAAPARHQTLHAAVAWSYDLLSADEQALFRRLSVFDGGFSLEAAEAVAGDGLPGVLELIPSLVDRCLVVAERPRVRYRLLETLRAYGRAQLEPDEAQAVHKRHVGFLVDLVARADEELRGPDQAGWLERLDAERDNLRAALRWSLAGGDPETGVRLVALLHTYWDLRGQYSDARAWIGTALDRSAAFGPDVRAEVLVAAAHLTLTWGDHAGAVVLAEQALALFEAGSLGAAHATTLVGLAALYQGEYDDAGRLLDASLHGYARLGRRWEQAAVLGRLGHLARMQGDYPLARTRLEEALASSRQVGDTGGTAWTVWQLGVLARYEGDYDRAWALCEESVPLFDGLGDTPGLAHVRYTLGDLARLRGDDRQAREQYETSLATLREHGDRRCVASTLASLAAVLLRAGEPAHHLLRESLSIRSELGDQAGIAECLEGFAAVLLNDDDPVAAVRVLGAADELRTATGAARPASDEEAHAGRLDVVRATLGATAFQRAWTAGRERGGARLAADLLD